MKTEECKDGKKYRTIYTNNHWGRRSNKNPYVIAKRLANHYIGKTFDEAFAHFCLKVEPRYQYYFKDRFNEQNMYYKREHLYLDENGFIRKENTQEKKIYSIQSADYKTELRHKVTGDKITQFEEVYNTVEAIGKYGFYKGKPYKKQEFSHLEYGANPYKMLPIGLRYKAQKTDFEPVCISGYIQYFESKQDPKFQRYHAEKNKARKTTFKKQKKQKQAEREHSRLIAERRVRLRMEREETRIKLEAKGMRPNVFTNHTKDVQETTKGTTQSQNSKK